MAQDVREANDVLLLLVVGDCEEVAEVVGEDLLPGDSGGVRELFHPAEDAAAVDGSAVSGDEDAAVRDAPVSAVLAELPAKGAVDEDGAGLALEGDDGAAGGEGGDCDEGEFADADAGARQGLHDESGLMTACLRSAGPVLRGPDRTRSWYSLIERSFSALRNVARWVLKIMTIQSCQPMYLKKVFRTDSMELALESM